METLLAGFSAEYQERLLDLLWRQWTAMGIAGHGTSWTGTPLDPEALVSVSCTVARRDPRLFDAMLDWLGVNAQYVNVHRLQRMLTAQPFAGAGVFAAVAATLNESSPSPRWSRASGSPPAGGGRAQEPLFFMSDGQALPVLREPDPRFSSRGFLRDQYRARQAAARFPANVGATLLLRLRALLGVSARCEILAYLLLKRRGSPRTVAQACGYYPATVAKALGEMGDSGYLRSHTEGRRRHYTLSDDAWRALFLADTPPPTWVAWPSLFAALEQVWRFLLEPGRSEQPPLAQASALRRALKDGVAASLARGGLPVDLGDLRRYPGEQLLPFFVKEMREVLDAIGALG